MSDPCLSILAGHAALDELRERGLCADRVRVVVGASGGPKWLVLHGLDRVVFPWLLAGASAQRPVHAVASSIGTWRFACLAHADPIAALERFADAYVAQRYTRRPSVNEVSRQAEGILDALLGPADLSPLVSHDKLRMHVIAARFRHVGAHEGVAQTLTLAASAAANAVHRRALSAFVERVVFDASGDRGPLAPWRTFPTRHVTLDATNLRSALMASAAIPAVMAGVINPPGAPRGTYRDGGITDYHFGREIDPKAEHDGIALYPHFYPHLVPGWFDKALPWRRTRGLSRVVVIAPSRKYVARLPNSRIPDRNDFVRLSDTERVQAWRRTLELGKQLGDEFGEMLDRGKVGQVAQPLP